MELHSEQARLKTINFIWRATRPFVTSEPFICLSTQTNTQPNPTKVQKLWFAGGLRKVLSLTAAFPAPHIHYMHEVMGQEVGAQEKRSLKWTS